MGLFDSSFLNYTPNLCGEVIANHILAVRISTKAGALCLSIINGFDQLWLGFAMATERKTSP
ncbi:hypothetical protein ASZ90_018035 [hydrocarbon metagenome]|uniref:Uncharacterized protein n=1 Tax=hydrocarbon metagenome TaxID=938273 RepID=A0A0W8E7F0_9ZZZZ